MKTTLEIPDALFRRVKATAAERGQSLKEFVGSALQEKLLSERGRADFGEPVWMRGFGKLAKLHQETQRIQERIREAFEDVEPEDRA